MPPAIRRCRLRLRRRPRRPFSDRHDRGGLRRRFARPARRAAAVAPSRGRHRHADRGRADQRAPLQPRRTGGSRRRLRDGLCRRPAGRHRHRRGPVGPRRDHGRLTVSVPAQRRRHAVLLQPQVQERRHADCAALRQPYPFGHGLSYTRFEYRNLEVPLSPVPIEDGEIVLSFDVANTGSRKGVEIPQLYVRDRLASVVRPVRN